jgi:hypothetical protein
MKRYTTTLIMKIAYGYQILSDDDEYIRMAENTSLAVARSGIPGTTPPDLLPFCAYFFLLQRDVMLTTQ